MSLRKILAWPDVRLATACAPTHAPDSDTDALITDMFETMYAARGRGLAASQIGEMVRVFVMDVSWKEGAPSPVAMINPELVWTSGETETAGEGCLSIEGITTEIERPLAIEMSWTTPEGIAMSRRMESAEARCAQHELDHLNGVVTLDRLDADARAIAIAAYEAGRG